MPKTSRVLKEFHGGLNSHSEKRDVANNELTQANDLQVDSLGKVTCMSSNTAATNGIVDKGITVVNPGHGLMHFQHDYAGMGTTYSSNIGLQNATSIPTSYTVLASALTYQYFYIFGHPQDDKIGVEIPVEFARTFPSGEATFWTNAGSCYQYDDEGDLSLIANAIGQYASLPVAKCPTNIGTAYRISFEVSDSAGSWFLKSQNGAQTISTITGDGTITLDFIATTTGGFRLEAGAINGYQIGGSEVWYNKITIDNISLVEGGWSQYFTLGSKPNFKMIGFVVDGVVRIHDANFDNTYTPKFFGYLKNKNFTTEESFEGWYSDDSRYTIPLSNGDTPAAGKFNHSIYGTTANANNFNGMISVDMNSDAGGSWDLNSKNYNFYITYIYEGGYDSDLVDFGDSEDDHDMPENNDNSYLLVSVYCKSGGDDTWHQHHSPRILGFRIYYSEIMEFYEHGISTMWCLQETYFDSNKGSRNPQSSQWSEWRFNSTDNLDYNHIKHLAPPEILTYEDINGYSSGEDINSSFKAVCVANRKVYVGNIKNDGRVYGDMMIKSPVNGFDAFPISRSLEVTVADGDEIIQLEEYADRILQFKRNKMHLINVSQEIEFLEDTFVHKGVSNPNATCKTDFGVAWVNKHGCYLYDGKQVSNLLERKNIKLIDEDDWLAHVGDKSIIEYLPKKRQLMVIKDYSSASGGKNIYLFDMVTQSWVTSDDAVITSTEGISSSSVDMTNTVIDKNGDLMWAYKGATSATFLKWSTTPVAQTNFALRTKALAFGNPVQRKKIYKVYITHKNAGDEQLGLYGEFHSQKAIASQGIGELSNDFFFGYLAPDHPNANNFVQQEFSVPSTNLNDQSIDFNSVYTMRLYILSNKVWSSGSSVPGADHEGTAPAGFEINDITVVYRLKSVK